MEFSGVCTNIFIRNTTFVLLRLLSFEAKVNAYIKLKKKGKSQNKLKYYKM